MNEGVMNLKLKKKKYMDFKEKDERLSEKKEFGVKMSGNGGEMRGDWRDLVMEFREIKWG